MNRALRVGSVDLDHVVRQVNAGPLVGELPDTGIPGDQVCHRRQIVLD